MNSRSASRSASFILIQPPGPKITISGASALRDMFTNVSASSSRYAFVERHRPSWHTSAIAPSDQSILSPTDQHVSDEQLCCQFSNLQLGPATQSLLGWHALRRHGLSG
eukprot:CAMPEP_0185345138 /NCGR_PEP_ID=MMETSP1363-20130426/100473_1 /TAXON_ID=38817 /ORGANISM="Gephyrocapsa oceanica, Strain RCC1303" /LENGTH=108 /DNA_ID=CAMNT_0027944365 /DNA_START=450 /DNA_END=774 /DNA_ORIENTATION=+